MLYHVLKIKVQLRSFESMFLAERILPSNMNVSTSSQQPSISMDCSLSIANKSVSKCQMRSRIILGLYFYLRRKAYAFLRILILQSIRFQMILPVQSFSFYNLSTFVL